MLKKKIFLLFLFALIFLIYEQILSQTQDLELMFDKQIERLEERELGQEKIKSLLAEKSKVIESASTEFEIPFIPVIPGSRYKLGLDPYHLQIFDLIEIPKEPYFIFDVSINSAVNEQRRYLTVLEALSLIFHSSGSESELVSGVIAKASETRGIGGMKANLILSIKNGLVTTQVVEEVKYTPTCRK